MGEDVERSSCGVVWDTIPALYGWSEENDENSASGLWDEILT